MKNNKNPGQEPLYTTEDVLYTNERLVKDKNTQMPEQKDQPYKFTKKDKFFFTYAGAYFVIAILLVVTNNHVYRFVDDGSTLTLVLNLAFLVLFVLYDFVAPARRWITKHIIDKIPE